jgi:biotin carboxyl carrier protein
VAAGDELAFAVDGGEGRGARAYVCVAGGVDVPVVMGSRSTDLTGGFGGLAGRALRAGDVLPLGTSPAPADALLRRRLAVPPPSYGTEMAARVVLGPQEDRFAPEGIAAFLGERYAATAKADRMGVRLDGPRIAHSRGADLRSEGIAHGAVQVPGDGRPIVLLAARQTVGGYPKVATVIGADLDRCGQLRPGNAVTFGSVDVAEARALTLAARVGLGDDAVVARPSPGAGWSAPGCRPTEGAMSMTDATGSGGTPGPAETDSAGAGTGVAGRLAGGWDPDGVVRVIAALREAGVTAFRLEVAAAGLVLELRRDASGVLGEAAGTGVVPSAAVAADAGGDAGDVARGAAARDPEDPGDGLVRAPVLGAFYRRSAPEAPALAEVGDRIAAGQPLGVVEVMKTYHEVAAPRAGRIAAFLAEDGQFVEYGQPVARLAFDDGDGV